MFRTVVTQIGQGHDQHRVRVTTWHCPLDAVRSSPSVEPSLSGDYAGSWPDAGFFLEAKVKLTSQGQGRIQCSLPFLFCSPLIKVYSVFYCISRTLHRHDLNYKLERFRTGSCCLKVLSKHSSSPRLFRDRMTSAESALYKLNAYYRDSPSGLAIRACFHWLYRCNDNNIIVQCCTTSPCSKAMFVYNVHVMWCMHRL